MNPWWHMFTLPGSKKRRFVSRGIDPDEVFLDASNLPSLEQSQFEGRVEQPLSRVTIVLTGIVFVLAGAALSMRTFDLQVVRGDIFAEASQNNRLSHSLVFAERGIMYDREGREIAWNEAEDDVPYARRLYAEGGFSHLVGFVRYPKSDESGAWWRSEIVGASGIEQLFEETLRGINGKKIVEVDALGDIHREQIIEPAEAGENITLTLDKEVQEKLHEVLAHHIDVHGFDAAASVIMDVATGEVLALTSVPEYDQRSLAEGDTERIQSYTHDERKPFLNRVVSGTYAPGSIVKPLFAAAALSEGIIRPEEEILSIGYISIPNPYVPGEETIMRDWKAHGYVDMREAIAVSSNVYFFTIGGGYRGREGLGIARLEAYARRFGFGEHTEIDIAGEEVGVIPTPEWKSIVFDGEPWRIGDTYNTSIGQYGFQITPIQAVRYVAAVANGGSLLKPQLLLDSAPEVESIEISTDDIRVVREGMRQAVVSGPSSPQGTAASLWLPTISIAAKTGTAQVGSRNEFMHSWVIGFWPYENPRYAFATVLERAPAGTLAGAAPSMRPFFEWLAFYKPEYASVEE